MIELGSIATDRISGFSGVVICRSEWLHGCTRYGIQPQAVHDGKPIEPQFFDEPQIRVIRTPEGTRPEESKIGGPRKDYSGRRAGE